MRENNKEKLFARTFSLLLTRNIGDLTLEEVALWKKVLTDAVASGEIGLQQDLDTVAAIST